MDDNTEQTETGNDEPETLLTCRQTAVILQCGVRTVQRLAQNGEIPAYKLSGINGQYAFPESGVKAYKKELDERWADEYE